MQALEIQTTTQANLQKEIELAQKNAAEMETRKQLELESSKLENMSEEKRALMAAYGFEDGDGTERGQGVGDAEEKPSSNRDHAAAISKQNAQKERAGQSQTKQEARIATAKAKADKMAKKEERRKKAGKRERHR